MIRRWIRQHLPTPEHFERLPVIHRFRHHLSQPNLWALNRRSVAGGVALGLFCGLIPGPLQIAGAVLLAVVFRVNLAVASVVTLYTNPLTIVPLYLVAVAYGEWLLGSAGQGHTAPAPEWVWSNLSGSASALLDWMLGLGPALAVGLPALMLTLAAAGYAVVRLAWAVGVRIQWARRTR
ncbi:MAG: DUF2062 domain-containing protein [Limnobacter sp.]|uniref:DUF2062 domain-containing protein n=1 Tax=Limnobacter sp. TaxID=2003368 RepID=UPI0039190061